MATKIKLDGVHPKYDGEYEIDFEEGFNYREWHEIKVLSGIRRGEFNDAVDADDADLYVAVAAVVLRRNDKPVDVNVLWESQEGISFTEDAAVAEDDADPPPLPPVTEPTSQSESSGKTTTSSSASPVNGQSPTGSPPSDTPAMSGLATSAT
jgi:hypothetical protein